MKLLTLKQVKDITQIPESTLRKWSKDKSFPAFKVGSSWQVDQEDLDRKLCECFQGLRIEQSALSRSNIPEESKRSASNQVGSITKLKSRVDSAIKQN